MFADEQARRDAQLAAGMSKTAEGFCTGYDWANRLVKVSIDGAEVPMPWTGEPPWRGMRVQVSYLAGSPRATAVVGAAMGVVLTVTGTYAKVRGDDLIEYTYPFPVGLTLSAGHRVLLDHLHQVVVLRYSDEPIGSDYRPEPPPTVAVGSAPFYPIDSANWRYGNYDGQKVEISESRSAAYFYGSQIGNTVPDAARITKAVLRLSAEGFDRVEGTDSRLRLHTQQSRAGEPTFSGPVINVRDGGEINIMPFADALKTGAAWGVGFERGYGWRQFDTFAASGAIYMEWTGG